MSDDMELAVAHAIMAASLDREAAKVPHGYIIPNIGAGMSLHLARAAIAAMPKAEWQPIETAPKDAAILVWTKDGTVEIGSFVLADFRDDGDATDSWCDSGAVATHWLPLPSPPSTAETAAKTEATEKAE